MTTGRPSVMIESESKILGLPATIHPHSAQMNAAAAMDAVTIGYEYHPKKTQPESAFKPHRTNANDNATAPTKSTGGRIDWDFRTSNINAIAPSERSIPT